MGHKLWGVHSVGAKSKQLFHVISIGSTLFGCFPISTVKYLSARGANILDDDNAEKECIELKCIKMCRCGSDVTMCWHRYSGGMAKILSGARAAIQLNFQLARDAELTN